MSFTGDRKPITQQTCSIRGCKNNAYLLYPLGGMKKIPICRDCLKLLTAQYQDLKFKEYQLYFNFMRG